ncbi:replicative DNA helicase [Stackebrandtia soli]|uniref:replicative DNA helicase n=1 Tax=Stackebrandtia soli TaxID=1892856 RepID=UPI0039E9EACD
MTEVMETGLERAGMHDSRIEQALLGAMMRSEDHASRAFELVSPEDFYEPRHQIIASTIQSRLFREPTDALSMGTHLFRDGHLEKVGGAPFLATLLEMSLPESLEWAANIVLGHARLRRLDETLVRSRQTVRNPSLDVEDVITRVGGWVTEAITTEVADTDEGLFHADQTALLERLRHPDPYSGLSTGLGSLDDVIHRLRAQQLILVAGRPGMGKSILAADIARHAAWHQAEPVLFVSLEMSREEIQARMLSAEADVPLELLVNPPRDGVPEAQLAKVEKALAATDGSLLHLHTAGTVTVAEIRARAVRLQRTVGLGLIVVDYLQLMSTSKSVESRQQEVSAISRDLKLLAMDLGIPVVACSQLNREAENRSTKRPQLSDLRESGSLEQDANVVILLHREAYYDETVRPGEVDLMVVKNRNGQTKTVTAAAQLHKARIVDMGVPGA